MDGVSIPLVPGWGIATLLCKPRADDRGGMESVGVDGMNIPLVPGWGVGTVPCRP